MAPKRNAEEIAKLLGGFQASGLTRVEYCRQSGITPHTLDYYRRRADTGQRLVRVKVRAAARQDGGFVLTLGNGRRIESRWEFSDGDLARLIRVAESA
jgi:hypothetical protein